MSIHRFISNFFHIKIIEWTIYYDWEGLTSSLVTSTSWISSGVLKSLAAFEVLPGHWRRCKNISTSNKKCDRNPESCSCIRKRSGSVLYWRACSPPTPRPPFVPLYFKGCEFRSVKTDWISRRRAAVLLVGGSYWRHTDNEDSYSSNVSWNNKFHKMQSNIVHIVHSSESGFTAQCCFNELLNMPQACCTCDVISDKIHLQWIFRQVDSKQGMPHLTSHSTINEEIGS